MIHKVRICSFIYDNKAGVVLGVVIFLSITVVSSEATPMLLNVRYTWKNVHQALKKLSLSTVRFPFDHKSILFGICWPKKLFKEYFYKISMTRKFYSLLNLIERSINFVLVTFFNKKFSQI